MSYRGYSTPLTAGELDDRCANADMALNRVQRAIVGSRKWGRGEVDVACEEDGTLLAEIMLPTLDLSEPTIRDLLLAAAEACEEMAKKYREEAQ